MTGRNAREFGLGRIAGQRKAETPENSAWAEFFGRRKAEMPGRKAREFGLGRKAGGKRPKSHGVSALGIRLGPKSQDRAEYPGPNVHLAELTGYRPTQLS
jgi:hypothetical protein